LSIESELVFFVLLLPYIVSQIFDPTDIYIYMNKAGKKNLLSLEVDTYMRSTLNCQTEAQLEIDLELKCV